MKELENNTADLAGDTSEILLIENNSTDIFIFENIWHLANPQEKLITTRSTYGALSYLSEDSNKNNVKTIFVEFNLPIHNGNYFLRKFEQLYAGYKNKPRVIVITSFLSGRTLMLIKKFNFISKVIEKPIKINHLLELC